MDTVKKRPVIHLNSAELLRRKQALIRQGQRMAFTHAVKPMPVIPPRRNTPAGPLRDSAKFLKYYDPKQKRLDGGKPMSKAGIPNPLEEMLIPKDVLLSHAVHITRRDLALKQDKLVRSIPTLDMPKPRKRKEARKAPEEYNQAERKLWRKMAWLDLVELRKLKV